jgi:hypothetical protein
MMNSPNERADDREERDRLLAELAYMPHFRLFIEDVIKPRVAEIRTRLLREIDIPEPERQALVGQLLGLERILGSVFDCTEAATMPDWLQVIFR